MRIVLNVVSNTPWEMVVPILKSLARDELEIAVVQAGMEQVGPDCNKSDSEFYLLFQWHPEKVIVQAMRAGIPPLESLNLWKTEAEHQVRFYERNQECSLLIDIDCLLQKPDQVLKRLPEELHLGDSYETLQSTQAQDYSGLHLLLANKVVGQNIEVQSVLTKLCSILSVQSEGWCVTHDQDVSQLYNELAAMIRVRQESEFALEVARRENQLLLAQLRRVENELDNAYRKITASHRKLKENAGEGLRGLYRKLRWTLTKIINPSNPVVWRITSPVRVLTRPIRKALS